jgi:hypothetical protein
MLMMKSITPESTVPIQLRYTSLIPMGFQVQHSTPGALAWIRVNSLPQIGVLSATTLVCNAIVMHSTTKTLSTSTPLLLIAHP